MQSECVSAFWLVQIEKNDSFDQQKVMNDIPVKLLLEAPGFYLNIASLPF